MSIATAQEMLLQNIDATLNIILPGLYADMFEHDFPLEGNDAIDTKRVWEDGAVVQFHIHIAHWHVRDVQIVYLMKFKEIMRITGYNETYRVTAGWQRTFIKRKNGV